MSQSGVFLVRNWAKTGQRSTAEYVQCFEQIEKATAKRAQDKSSSFQDLQSFFPYIEGTVEAVEKTPGSVSVLS